MDNSKTTAGPVISRETYRSLKHRNRKQLASFCEDIYMSGYKDGRASVPGVDVEQLYKVIASVPGIGEKRLAQIKAAVEAAFGQEGKEDTT